MEPILMKTVCCTIVSANYLAYAATLRDSLKLTDPELPFRVLVVDRRDAAVEAVVTELSLEVDFVEDLGIEGFEGMAFRYDIMELNTNVKPFFLKGLLARGFERVVYCDPDVYFYSPLLKALQVSERSSIVLTPHVLGPAEEIDDELPLLQTGVFNLGFVAVRNTPEGLKFLDWWGARCSAAAYFDFPTGQFVDQKWIDLVPALFADFFVLRERGLNVAYWNIHERELHEGEGDIRVAGDPLVFFHFSGLARAGEGLTRHKKLKDSAPLRLATQLGDRYRSRLVENLHERVSKLPYGFGFFDDRQPILPIYRLAYAASIASDPGSNPFQASSAFGRQLRGSPIWSRHAPGVSASKAGKPADVGRAQSWITRLLGMTLRVIGPGRYWFLCRYLAANLSFLRQGQVLRALLGTSQ
jgi:hypothetical protein